MMTLISKENSELTLLRDDIGQLAIARDAELGETIEGTETEGKPTWDQSTGKV